MTLHWQVENSPQLSTLDSSAALNIIRIVQEAFVNAVKHSKAKNITLRTDINCIKVIDDGIGFEVDYKATKHGTHSGIGIEGIRERCRSLGIACDIKSGSDGTQVTLNWHIESDIDAGC